MRGWNYRPLDKPDIGLDLPRNGSLGKRERAVKGPGTAHDGTVQVQVQVCNF